MLILKIILEIEFLMKFLWGHQLKFLTINFDFLARSKTSHMRERERERERERVPNHYRRMGPRKLTSVIYYFTILTSRSQFTLLFLSLNLNIAVQFSLCTHHLIFLKACHNHESESQTITHTPINWCKRILRPKVHAWYNFYNSKAMAFPPSHGFMFQTHEDQDHLPSSNTFPSCPPQHYHGLSLSLSLSLSLMLNNLMVY